MPKKQQPMSPAQVRASLALQGKTLTQWALERGFPRQEVYRVMGGQCKALYGRGHEIAVALGLKVPEEEPSTPMLGRNTQARAAA